MEKKNTSSKIDIKLVSKGMSCIACLILIILEIIQFVAFNYTGIQNFFMLIYILLFASLLLLAEFNFEFLLKQFQLLNNYMGRGIYGIFLGILCISDHALGIIAGILLILCGFIYIFLFFKGEKVNSATKESNQQGQPRSNEMKY